MMPQVGSNLLLDLYDTTLSMYLQNMNYESYSTNTCIGYI